MVDAGGHYTALTALSDTRTFSPSASSVCFYFSQQNVKQTPNAADTRLKRSVLRILCPLNSHCPFQPFVFAKVPFYPAHQKCSVWAHIRDAHV